MDKIQLHVEPELKELIPGFLDIRDVGRNIRCFARVYGVKKLTALGEQTRCAAELSK